MFCPVLHKRLHSGMSFVPEKTFRRERGAPNFGVITNWRCAVRFSSQEFTLSREDEVCLFCHSCNNCRRRCEGRKEQFHPVNSRVSVKYVWPLCVTRREAENCKSEPGLGTLEKSPTNSGETWTYVMTPSECVCARTRARDLEYDTWTELRNKATERRHRYRCTSGVRL